MTDQSISKPQGAARSTKGLMQKTINHLIQLQDLLIARAQQEASMEDVRLEQLDAAIQAMYEQLPPPIAAQFKRIA